MEIHNHGNNSKIQINSDKSNREVGGVEGESKVERSAPVGPQQLVERLEGDAAIRERLLVEVKAKVLAGEYLTRAAAEEAAQHIVDE